MVNTSGPIHHTNAALFYQVVVVGLKGLLVLLVLPTVSSLIWRLPGPGRTNPIMDITSRLFHMGQTMARLMGSLSGNYPSSQYHHYQHYQHHHNTGKTTRKSSLDIK